MEFEPTISAGERPQTYVLDRAATGTGTHIITVPKYKKIATFKNNFNSLHVMILFRILTTRYEHVHGVILLPKGSIMYVPIYTLIYTYGTVYMS